MNNFKQGLIVFILLLLPVSCTYDCLTVDLHHTWKVTSIHSLDSTEPAGPYPGGEIIITYKRDKSFDLILDVNTCNGTYTFDDHFISLAISGCTKICCDSDFSLKLVDMLTGAESYEIEATRLTIFSDNGFINLELY